MKGIDVIARADLRQHRAQQLVAAILNEIGPVLNELRRDPNTRAERDIHERLVTLLSQAGAEIFTDYDRAQNGLPPRGPDGWTAEEIAAVEWARLELITRHMVMPITTPPPA